MSSLSKTTSPSRHQLARPTHHNAPVMFPIVLSSHQINRGTVISCFLFNPAACPSDVVNMTLTQTALLSVLHIPAHTRPALHRGAQCRPLSHPYRRGHTRTAFSLVEILIVTVCLAIAAMLVLPAMASTHVARLQAAGKLMVADLQFAQLRAMGNSADTCVVVLNPTNNQYHLAHSSDPTTPIKNPATGQPYLTTFGGQRGHQLAGVTFDALSVGGDNKLGFTSLGQLDQAANATITLRCADHTLTISINAATGQTSLN